MDVEGGGMEEGVLVFGGEEEDGGRGEVGVVGIIGEGGGGRGALAARRAARSRERRDLPVPGWPMRRESSPGYKGRFEWSVASGQWSVGRFGIWGFEISGFEI